VGGGGGGGGGRRVGGGGVKWRSTWQLRVGGQAEAMLELHLCENEALVSSSAMAHAERSSRSCFRKIFCRLYLTGT
jgi:hypothetical protein